MRFNKTILNVVNTTIAYAGRALVIGLVGMSLSVAGCDDEDPTSGRDAAPDTGADTRPVDANDTKQDGSNDTGKLDTQGGDVPPGDALLGDALPG